MRRVFWTVGMGAAGLVLGLKGQDTSADALWAALVVLWFASLGHGIGSIFDEKRPTKRLVIYWSATLALAAPF